MAKEAKARIRINDLLTRAGWRFFDDQNGPTNISLETNVKLKRNNSMSWVMTSRERRRDLSIIFFWSQAASPLLYWKQSRRNTIRWSAKSKHANTRNLKRINSARDILVGKVPDPKSQVEQITIALIYKFMDDMDRQSEELGGKASFFSDGFKKYAWHKLIDPRLSGHERLMIYAEGLEKMNENKHIPQLFRDIFKGVFLPYRDPETLNLFLKQINEFSYEHSERLGDAFEYLLSVLGSQGDAGQFRTPRHIIDLIVSIVDPKKNETVLDPACGTAGFLISAYKHILAANSKDGKGDLLTGDER